MKRHSRAPPFRSRAPRHNNLPNSRESSHRPRVTSERRKYEINKWARCSSARSCECVCARRECVCGVCLNVRHQEGDSNGGNITSTPPSSSSSSSFCSARKTSQSKLGCWNYLSELPMKGRKVWHTLQSVCCGLH